METVERLNYEKPTPMTQSAFKPADSTSPRGQREIGLAHYRNEEWTDAVAAFDGALQAGEPSAEADLLLWRGMALVQSGAVADGTADLELAAAAGHLEAKYQVALQYGAQARTQRPLREKAIAHLEAIIEAHDSATGDDAPGDDTLAAGLDRVCFTLGGLYGEGEEDDDEGEGTKLGIAAYRRGLSINPLSPAGHNNLGLLLMKAEQPLAALGEFKLAIQLDPAYRAAHSNLARLLFKHMQGEADLAREFEHIVEEFGDRASTVISHLSLELVELGREQVHRSLYTKGHQLKNLMGLVGSRLKGVARKMAVPHNADELREEMVTLEAEHERLYDEWVGYLSTMTPDKLNTGLVEPSRIVRRVVDAVRIQAGSTQLSLRVQEGVPRIEADERLLREAVTNLTLNALEALVDSPAGEISLGVGFDDSRGGVVFIEVEDDGPGIPHDLIDHIFDAGFTTRDGGNGYGLSIARRIAQAHHGELRVVSRAGLGTVFRLDLPVNFDAESRPDSLSNPSP